MNTTLKTVMRVQVSVFWLLGDSCAIIHLKMKVKSAYQFISLLYGKVQSLGRFWHSKFCKAQVTCTF